MTTTNRRAMTDEDLANEARITHAFVAGEESALAETPKMSLRKSLYRPGLFEQVTSLSAQVSLRGL
ncbi:hypothetical protein GCM10009655_19800 [Rhodoglobus aureus]|uniref:Uncharacterized protein n=1 Tax=Rhodoglobus aureus TaxID=191497 RepID=A0ABP4GBR8_9MICO